jgi:hypothetical protein
MIQTDLNYSYFTLSLILVFVKLTNQQTIVNASVSQYLLTINNSSNSNKILQRRICYFANWVST